ncbi:MULTISPECIES: 23S rRNA (cytidine(2498)-2'-O)-methyltransferase RlmM [Corallincola]|uniref:Ribosomal RNA large subunit methyltransferase M n=3 Tax=Corallincola TaxID=1775176 RepID=A0A368NF54_9GAMM|nr:MULTISPECIES: 23S rRNA (cytidine(2498)-2'-O)-methyltransferase RlmM [Corallincola]RCU48846.1 23S rRNA (cytidine(2498)-2'-O)-methyltransferase RlmM [Corallincola holothuriorum]TAA43740.1 23S rRNA (cytidine(2498)-2'-O)-methyltransferase RlmM [Corallincola spongiicola]TCI02987.1 23S rRNA (cytidine(2498)-2'-O)-methyltransferase RlmM [Corallincola luteus]
MNALLLYCRPGFEKECAAEITQRAMSVSAGYAEAKPNTGYVLYRCFTEGDAEYLVRRLQFWRLIFARQMIACVAHLQDMSVEDRISEVVAAASEFPLCGELMVEPVDTNEGKELSKFCRKFSVPLRQALRKHRKLTDKPKADKPVFHLCVLDGAEMMLGYSIPGNNSRFEMGIPRLRLAKDAPSRSALKLEEAFMTFVPPEEMEKRVTSGMNAVDLGASPGGWTYQLVRRGMMVSAVDNGPMDEGLMETGQVKHFMADGFGFEPKRKNITWLVCDMVEKPGRIARLMGQWLANRWCEEAIFNLKLPMKQRFSEAERCLELMKQFLRDEGVRYQVTAKHLYHDREEITVHLRREPRRDR